MVTLLEWTLDMARIGLVQCPLQTISNFSGSEYLQRITIFYHYVVLGPKLCADYFFIVVLAVFLIQSSKSTAWTSVTSFLSCAVQVCPSVGQGYGKVSTSDEISMLTSQHGSCGLMEAPRLAMMQPEAGCNSDVVNILVLLCRVQAIVLFRCSVPQGN